MNSVLERKRTAERRRVSAHAQTIEDILRAHLDTETFEQIKEEWMNRPAVDAMYPEQRRDFLIRQAVEHDLLMEIPIAVFGGKSAGR